MWGLQRHSDLVRLCLGVGGRLTLTGLHQPRPQLRWQLSTAIPLGCFILVTLAGVLAPGNGVRELMSSVATLTFLIQASALLATLVIHRDRLRRLNEQLERLERRSGPLCGVGQGAKLQVLAVWLLTALLSAEWIGYAFVDRAPDEPPSAIAMWTPESLRKPPGSWAVFAFQVLTAVWSCCLQATFDSCYPVWMKAASYHLKTIRRTLSEHCRDRKKADEVTEDEPKPDEPKVGDVVSTNRGRISTVEMRPEPTKSGWPLSQTSVKITEGDVLTPESSAVSDDLPGDSDISGVSVTALREADQYYDSVAQLVSDINELTSLPSLLNHATTLINILVGAFLMLRAVLLLPDVTTAVSLTSSGIELSMFVFRLTIYSLGGDEIVRESAALRQAVVGVPWQRLTSRASQHRSELLLKLQQPLCVEPLGFFTVRKGNLLSMTGLFLTYFVIIIQMVQEVTEV